MPPKVVKVIVNSKGKANATPQAKGKAKVQDKANANGTITKHDLEIKVGQHAPQ